MPASGSVTRNRELGSSPYRAELQGLRALAVGLVVVYHVWLNRISGGVDIFFLLSGFLVTGQLVRAVQRGGIRFGALWGRMLTRLVPAAAVVLAATTVASILILPQDRWFQTIREIVAAALFLENWQLAADSVDYFAQNNVASVAQHFWSLSIQGQFYLVWPLLIGLLGLIAVQNGRDLRRYVAGALTVIGAASLAYSVALTATDQPLAYFHSLTRVWEFALGGLLALGINAITLARGLRIVLGWLGVLGLLSCGVILNVGSEFPGYAALWPTISAALVLIAGATGSRLGADRWLGSRPLTYLGDLSYPLYLWHWPILVLYLVHQGITEVSWREGLGIIAVSLLLAALTQHLLAEPAREIRMVTGTRWGAYRFAALLTTIVLVLAGGWQLAGLRAASPDAQPGDQDHPGALAHSPGFQYQGRDDAVLLPPRITLEQDWATTDDMDCTRSARNEDLEICSSSIAEPARRIVVIGDSHMQQYLAAVRPIAQRQNWQVIVMLKGVCPFSVDADAMPGDQPCIDWNAAAAEEIVDMRPDAVLTLASRDVRAGLSEQTPPGFVAQWQRLAESGIRVLAVRDNPRFGFSPAVCAYEHGPDHPDCATPRDTLLATNPPYTQLPDVPGNVTFIDFSDYYCTAELCPPVVGNVLVYMDHNHTTASFMTTLSPVLEKEMLRALE
ncbi:acyltransferase family protein [Crossiella sp. CA-258035]|uniref:acyltransferase family protein n=1 Tax=Crossiella sp. CA-258035 TaxID=2981138 RepID=UPI0024BC2CD8|nr:acyltransferase family protein [Crossiella sp. CA-258035]WHT23464.1 acyltransferase family protein [Crossiella sp. CA-258035]